ncbi:MAG: hypothetical protein ACXQT3_03865, partial [Methermicoccaceae archaeon]
IEKFEKETEYDEGGVHYIVFGAGEVGLFDEYELADDIVRQLDDMCEERAEFSRFRVWNITGKEHQVLRLLQEVNEDES